MRTQHGPDPQRKMICREQLIEKNCDVCWSPQRGSCRNEKATGTFVMIIPPEIVALLTSSPNRYKMKKKLSDGVARQGGGSNRATVGLVRDVAS